MPLRRLKKRAWSAKGGTVDSKMQSHMRVASVPEARVAVMPRAMVLNGAAWVPALLSLPFA